MEVKLIELSMEDGLEVYDFLSRFEECENGFYNPIDNIPYEDFKIFLEDNIKNSKGMDLKEGYVPQTLYWLSVDDKLVGIGKLRHYLNGRLLKSGGHIGYGILKSERKKGYGNLILQELLKKAKTIGIDKALVTCDENNLGSRRVIENNKGILEKIEEGNCHYWIG